MFPLIPVVCARVLVSWMSIKRPVPPWSHWIPIKPSQFIFPSTRRHVSIKITLFITSEDIFTDLKRSHLVSLLSIHSVTNNTNVFYTRAVTNSYLSLDYNYSWLITCFIKRHLTQKRREKYTLLTGKTLRKFHYLQISGFLMGLMQHWSGWTGDMCI